MRSASEGARRRAPRATGRRAPGSTSRGALLPGASGRLFAGVACGVLGLSAGAARAEEIIEPSYGRVEGDLTLVAGAGASIASGGPRATGDLRARYLETAGIFGTYEDGSLVGSDAAPRRVVAAGFEMRPFFLYRWLQGQETRRARFDLAVDSIGLELGLTWQQPQGGSFSSNPGFEAGFGFEVPLFLDATGLWLAFHGGLRWSQEALGSGVVETTEQREAYLSVTLAWHQVIAVHIVDVGDRAPE